MAEKAHELNDNTRFAMPVRNLISMVVAVAFGVWGYFGIIERLNKIETQAILVQSDLVKNTEFRIKWPRGDLGSLPADSEQFMLIDALVSSGFDISVSGENFFQTIFFKPFFVFDKYFIIS